MSLQQFKVPEGKPILALRHMVTNVGGEAHHQNGEIQWQIVTLEDMEGKSGTSDLAWNME